MSSEKNIPRSRKSATIGFKDSEISCNRDVSRRRGNHAGLSVFFPDRQIEVWKDVAVDHSTQQVADTHDAWTLSEGGEWDKRVTAVGRYY